MRTSNVIDLNGGRDLDKMHEALLLLIVQSPLKLQAALSGPAGRQSPNSRLPRHPSGAPPYSGQLDPNGSLQLLGMLPVSRVFDIVTLPSSEREIPPPETSALFPTMNELLKVPCGSSNPT